MKSRRKSYHSITKAPPTTLRSLVAHRINVSNYEGEGLEEYRGEFTQSMFDSLLDHRIVECTEKLDVGGTPHSFHLYVVVGSEAIVFRGVDDKLFPMPLLCPDSEAFTWELLRWRIAAGLDPEHQRAEVNRSGDELTEGDFDQIAEAVSNSLLEDTFVEQMTPLVARLKAAALPGS